LPFAFYLRAIGFGLKKKALLAAASFLLVLFSILGSVALVIGAGIAFGIPFGAGAPRPMEGVRLFSARSLPAAVEVTPEVVMEVPVEEKALPAQKAEAPRLRQFFPETLYWNPEAITDEKGRLSLSIPMADTITTWRLSCVASSQNGKLGAGMIGIRVFQDFFVEIDLPVSLTQNDEVAMPVAVHNYLPEGQNVRLTLEEADWFELLDERTKEIYIGANDVGVVYFRIKVIATSGRYRPVVTAIGERMSDATTSEHDVIIFPDGKRFELTVSDRLTEEVEKVIPIPTEVIQGTAKITVKIHPGIVSQVVEGLEEILRMPFG
jgi:hypothetical protein